MVYLHELTKGHPTTSILHSMRSSWSAAPQTSSNVPDLSPKFFSSFRRLSSF